MDTRSLPKEILLTAFKASNGEYGWKRQHIVSALMAIVDSKQAILGGQIWGVENGVQFAMIQGAPSDFGFKLWDTDCRASDEDWVDYCHRTLDESIRQIETLEFEKIVPLEHQDFFFINPTYIEENDVRALIPRNKFDHERVVAAIAAGYPAVAPILPDLLEWLQDMNWPVAQELAPFLADIGIPLVPHIRKIFESDDDIWKYWIIVAIIKDSREIAVEFREDLARIAYSPTESELKEELHEQADDVLEKYGWGQ